MTKRKLHTDTSSQLLRQHQILALQSGIFSPSVFHIIFCLFNSIEMHSVINLSTIREEVIFNRPSPFVRHLCLGFNGVTFDFNAAV